MKFIWREFRLDAAKVGTLIGFPTTPPSGNGTIEENIDDISKKAGCLATTPNYQGYKVVINGETAYIDNDGKVVASVPSGLYAENTQSYLATTTISEVIGGTITRSIDDPDTSYTNNVDLTVMEPRDNFAIQILSAMLVHAGNPETFDDANVMLYSRAAYRWAQGMLNAAANTRHGAAVNPSTHADINAGDLQSNSEKLLYNISAGITDLKSQLGTNKSQLTTDISGMSTQLHTDFDALTTQIATDNEGIKGDLDTIAGSMAIHKSEDNIIISSSIYNQKFVRFEVQAEMLYSDLSVLMRLSVKEGTEQKTYNINYTLGKGSVIVVEGLDPAVTEITSIDSAVIRGQGTGDQNTYVLTIPTPE